eukprot:12893361-Prorocentrum_lima.AAC.1
MYGEDWMVAKTPTNVKFDKWGGERRDQTPSGEGQLEERMTGKLIIWRQHSSSFRQSSGLVDVR